MDNSPFLVPNTYHRYVYKEQNQYSFIAKSNIDNQTELKILLAIYMILSDFGNA